jgi:hypothetical protein
MPDHTPGPWKVFKLPGASMIGVVPVNARGRPRQGRETPDICQCEQEADARLIAAAPELLTACKEALAIVTAYAPGERQLEMLRAALAKAEGKG